MRTIRQLACALAVGVGLATCATAPSLAQTWPQRTVRVIVSNPPGVAMDVIARLFAERLAVRWGQPVVVENLPGVDGIVAAREFATRRDDHTLLYSFPSLIAVNPLVHEKLPYDPARDLVPIASTSENGLVIAVSGKLNVASLKELAERARSAPGKLTWAATPGVPYYALVAFQQRAEVKMVQAPYRNFNQALIDLGEGRIDAAAAGAAPFLPHARAGKIRLIAFVNRARSSIAPDVPTAAEAGYPELTFSAGTGFFGWRDMLPDLQARIAADIRDIAAEAAIRDRLAKIGITARGNTPEEFAASIAEQRAQIAGIVRFMKSAR